MGDRPIFSRSHFNSLSTETLLLIVRQLPNIQDLANLARVNRRLHPIATEVLYEDLKLATIEQAEELIESHGLHLHQPKVVHLATYTRKLDIRLKHLEGKPSLSAPALNSPLEYRSASASPREESLVTWLIQACKSKMLQSLSLSFDSIGAATEHSCYASLIQSAGLICSELRLDGCHYEAVPWIIDALSTSLESVTISMPTEAPTADEFHAARSNASDIYENLQIKLPKLRKVNLKGYPLFEWQPFSTAFINVSSQLEDLSYDGWYGSEYVEDDEELYKVLLQCSFPMLKKLKGSCRTGRSLAYVFRTAPSLEYLEADIFEADRSLLPRLPLTLKSLKLYGLSHIHDPPMDLPIHLDRLQHLASTPDLFYQPITMADEKAFYSIAAVAEENLKAHYSSRNPPISSSRPLIWACASLQSLDPEYEDESDTEQENSYEDCREDTPDWGTNEEGEDAMAFDSEMYPEGEDSEDEEGGYHHPGIILTSIRYIA